MLPEPKRYSFRNPPRSVFNDRSGDRGRFARQEGTTLSESEAVNQRRRGSRDHLCGMLDREFDVERRTLASYIASVNIKQRYYSPFGVKIEAVYAFPLPQNAAINGFVMTIGDRRIRGVIREKEEAKEIYNQARAQGKVAPMMSQQRPNIFTQRVANIEPGREIDIDITYHHSIAYDDGWHEWVFPMTIGPRYNPMRFRNGIGAVTRAVRNTALDYGLLTAFTSYVAVDSLSQTSGDHGYTVGVPVHAPRGTRYTTSGGG